MAKKVKFPLEMRDGVKVRTLEELQEYFDIEKAFGYLMDGSLKTWLEDRYYNQQANEISKLDIHAPNINEKLGAVLGITPELCATAEIDIEEISKKKERLTKLKLYTDNESIWDKIDNVAFDQEELACLLDEGCNEIYLCGENFQVPYSVGNTSYTGINQPKVFINADGEIDLDEQHISFNEVNILNADVGNADFFYNKGMDFLWGRNGKEKDNEQAFYYLKKAHDKGHIDAAVRILSAMYDMNKNLFELPNSYHYDYKLLSNEEAPKCKEKAHLVMFCEGYHLIYNEKLLTDKKDMPKLEKSIDEFIEKGSMLAVYLKGILMYTGEYYINIGEFSDRLDKARLLLQKSMDRGVPEAAYALGNPNGISSLSEEIKENFLKRGIELKSANCACEMAKWNGGRNKRKYLKLAMEFEETGIPSGNGRAYCDYADICDNIDDKISYYKKAVQYKNILALEKLILIYFYGDKTQQHDLEKVKEYSVMLLNWERRYGYLSNNSSDGIIPFITGILLYKGERVERNIYEGIARIWDAIAWMDNYDEYGVEEPNYNDDDDEEEEDVDSNYQYHLLKEFVENYTLDLVKENVTDDVVYAYWIRGGLIYVQTQINGIGQDVCIYFIEYDKLFDGFKGKLLYTINSTDMLAYKPVIKSCTDYYSNDLYLLISFFNWGTAVMIKNPYDLDYNNHRLELYNDFDIKRFNDFKVTSRKKLYIHSYSKLLASNHTHYKLSYGCSDNQNRCVVSTWKGESY